MKILIICSANMCRSPMAEVLLRALAEKENLDMIVRSAGTMDIEGAEPVANARIVCRQHGLSLERFRSSPLSKVDVRGFDMVLAMEEKHRKIAQGMIQGGSPPVHLLGDFLFEKEQPFEISDPVGRDLIAFQECFEVLKGCLTAFIRSLPAFSGR